MKADSDPSPNPAAAVLARARRATAAIEPPADFPARVLSLVAATSRPGAARPRVTGAWWAQLGPAGKRVVPFAAIAAAAAMALAWSADAHLGESADSAIDLAQELP